MLNNAGFSVLNLPPLNNGFEAFFEDVKAEVQETGGSKYSASATKRFNDLIAEDSAPRCRQCRTGTGVPAFGRALRAPVQASAGLGRALRAPVPAFSLQPALRASIVHAENSRGRGQRSRLKNRSAVSQS